MTQFPDIALMRINESFNLYQVYEDCYVSPQITIPKGFVTDFASIPRLLWNILPPHGKVMPASVLHDFYYTTHPLSGEMTMVDERRRADLVFYENLVESGVSEGISGIMLAAVRAFGSYRFKHYGKSRKTVRHEEKIKENRQERLFI